MKSIAEKIGRTKETYLGMERCASLKHGVRAVAILEV
jgi:hypothetical protein